jgi:DNA-directed RNA polymerase alpha subunit
MNKSNMQQSLLKEFLKLMEHTEGFSKKDITMLRLYLTTESTEKEIGDKHKMSAEGVKEKCQVTANNLLRYLKMQISQKKSLKKAHKEYIIREEERRKEEIRLDNEARLRRAQATKTNPDVLKIGFDQRIEQILSAARIVLLKDLTQITEYKFSRFRHAGKKTIEEVKKKLQDYNLSFKKS